MLKKIKELIFGRNLVVYRLRKVLRKLYEGYPTHQYTGYLQQEIGFKEGIDNLEEDGIIKQDSIDQNLNPSYRLTANGLRLVELWNTERLTLFILLLALIEIFLWLNFI